MIQATSRGLQFDVRGLPHPQGSMRTHALPNGKVAVRYPPAVWDWRHKVQQAAIEAMQGQACFVNAVKLNLGFDLQRPAAHYGTGRNARALKPSAPAYPINKLSGDIDKYSRAICDSLTDAAVWEDDSQVVYLVAAKRYVSDNRPPGVLIRVEELLD
jgi:Holliday junction resolvase RusA-like endonuclease